MDEVSNKQRDVSCSKLCNSLAVFSDENKNEYFKDTE